MDTGIDRGYEATASMFALRNRLRLGAWLALITTAAWTGTPCVCLENSPLDDERVGRGSPAVSPCHGAAEDSGSADDDPHCEHHDAWAPRVVLKTQVASEQAINLPPAVAPTLNPTPPAPALAARGATLPWSGIPASGRSLLARHCTLLL